MRVETFHTPGPVSLELRVPVGSVSVETADGEETRVEIASIDADEEIEQLTIVDHSGDRVLVAMQEERKFLFLRTIPGIDVRIVCPPNPSLRTETVSADVDTRRAGLAEADVKTVSGDTRVDAVVGDARVKTVSGDVEVNDVGGSLTAQAVSGDLRVRRVASRLELRTVSGDVEVDDADGDVTVQTTSGDVELRAVRTGRVALKTISGDMTVGIREGSALWIDAKSVSGDTSSDLPLGDTPPNGDAPLVEVRATAMSGDIRIVRA